MIVQKNRLNSAVFVGILFLLVFSPLAFGSVHVWAYTLLCIGVFFLCFLFFLDRFFLSDKNRFVWIKTPINFIFIVFIFLILFQLVPLPHKILSIFSPITAADKLKVLDILSEIENSGVSSSDFLSIAYYRHPVLIELTKILAYICMFMLVLHVADSRKRLEILIIVLMLLGLFEAVYGMFQKFSHAPRVWWWESRVGRMGYASGTYIVSNHFAFYLEITLCLTVGYLAGLENRARRMVSGLKSIRTPLQRVIAIFSPESSSPKRLFFFFAAIMMGVALLLSGSRAGILSFSAAMLCMSLILSTIKKMKKVALGTVFLFLLTLAHGVYVGMDPTIEKFEVSDAGLEKRLITSRSMIPMLLDYPVIGTGLGNFRYIYRRYVPVDYDGVSSSGYSHNDWLEVGTDTGFIGLAIVLLGFVLFFAKMFGVWAKRRDMFALGIGGGAMAALLSAAFHSFWDLNMHIPANPLALAAIAAIGFAVLHLRMKGYQEKFFYREKAISINTIRKAGIGIIVLTVLFFPAWIISRHFLAEIYCPTEWNSTLNLDWHPPPAKIVQALEYNSMNAEYFVKLAKSESAALPGDIENEEKEERIERSIDNLVEAVRLNPAWGWNWYLLGEQFLKKSYDFYNYFNKWVPLAEKCFDMAVHCAPVEENLLFKTARFWVWRSDTIKIRANSEFFLGGILSENNAEHDPNMANKIAAVEKFQDLFKRVLVIAPGRLEEVLETIWKYYPEETILLGIVPEEKPEITGKILNWVVTRKG